MVIIWSFGIKKENKRMDDDTEGLPPNILINPGVIPVEACASSFESNINASFCLCLAIILNKTSRDSALVLLFP